MKLPVGISIPLICCAFGAEASDFELTEFGQVLTQSSVTIEDEIAAAGYLADYFDEMNRLVPNISPKEQEWLDAELASGNMNKVAYALGRTEGCFGLYKKIAGDLTNVLRAIANSDAKKLAARTGDAPEDLLWAIMLAKLTNPITTDVLNCPSRFLDDVSPFNPISNMQSDESDSSIVLMVASQVLQKFIVEDERIASRPVADH